MRNSLTGDERFYYGDEPFEMTLLDFWRWHFSDIYDLQDKIAEYIVAKALGCIGPDNTGSWTLFDISYQGKRLEVKETSYFHSWQTDEETKSKRRAFGISKAYSTYQDNTSELARQNDIYVFCLNIGETRAASNPLQLENWEFYVIPTSEINEKCADGKTISLSRIRKLAPQVGYKELKKQIDDVIKRIDEDGE